jgi:hypothetical protein
MGKQSLDRISLDQNCHFSVDQNFTNHLIEFFDTFHLIKSLNNEFDQTPKKLSLDRNFKKPKIPLLELSINCQKRTDGFWQLIETF